MTESGMRVCFRSEFHRNNTLDSCKNHNYLILNLKAFAKSVPASERNHVSFCGKK